MGMELPFTLSEVEGHRRPEGGVFASAQSGASTSLSPNGRFAYA
jgi:hypothetical protein